MFLIVMMLLQSLITGFATCLARTLCTFLILFSFLVVSGPTSRCQPLKIYHDRGNISGRLRSHGWLSPLETCACDEATLVTWQLLTNYGMTRAIGSTGSKGHAG
jgi:hypothetical protein